MGLRGQILRRLPVSLRQHLKKAYYPGLLRRFEEADWPFAPLVRKLVEPGDWVVDAGANIGYLSKLLAGYVGAEGRVVSFEPVPPTFALLQHNMTRLGLAQVTPVNAGLSREAGQGRIEVPEYDGGGENFYESRLVDAAGSGRSFEVTLESLDHYFAELPPSLSLVKIDVEGHEAAVIEGGLELLRACRPALLIEVEGRLHESGTPAGRMHGLLEELGYAAYIWFEDQLIPWEAPATAIDFLYLQPAQVERAQ